MADISSYLRDIEIAIHGEEVRGSIHDAIKVINDVAENVLTTSDSNPISVTGYFAKSLWLNTTTSDLFLCNGSKWNKISNLKGISIASIIKTATTGLVDTYTITLTDGTEIDFYVSNGNGIVSINKTATDILKDTYTITYENGQTKTFDVYNGNGIVSIEKTGVDGLIDVYTITYSNGATQDFDVTNGNGIDSIEKTSSEGLVDEYTIYYTDGTSKTINITNGKDGVNGNKWYRGNVVSGKSTAPAQFTLNVKVNENDNYLNNVEGTVYHCTQGAEANSPSLWSYDFELTGGGSGGIDNYADLEGKPQIEGTVLSSGNNTAASLKLIKNPTTKEEGQVLTYRDGAWVAEDSQGGDSAEIFFIGTLEAFNTLWASMSDEEKDLHEGQIVHITNDYTDDDFIDQVYDGTSKHAQSGIAMAGVLSGITTKLTNLDSDGEIDYSHVKNTPNPDLKADKSTTYTKTEVDEKVDNTAMTETVASDGTVTFQNVDVNKTYELYVDVDTSTLSSGASPVGIETITLTGTTLKYKLTNAKVGVDCKLREIKL